MDNEKEQVVQVDALTLNAVSKIVEMSIDDSPKIGYDLFVRDYLPELARPLGVDAKGNVEQRDLTFWLTVCRCPTNEVQVLNKDGSVRFVVPPLVGTLQTYYAPERSSLMDIAQEVSEASANSPVYGQRILSTRLKEYEPATPQVVDGVQYDPRAVAWSKVLEEHGYPPLFGNQPAVTQAAADSPKEPNAGLFEDDCYDEM